MVAAMASGRNFIGFEIDHVLKPVILSRLENIIEFSNNKIKDRLQKHLEFVENRVREKGPLRHINHHYGFPVMTSQEKDLLLNSLLSFENTSETAFEVIYSDNPQKEFILGNDAV